ncbi:hypothetical protein GB931_06620 [Modestobacter sp. I12A-02628]|uniref:Uncharacterized protein n=1 Tax=Goekera deserti TaxID=2497753 RepID=A0A7K3WB43_9ACTN|nr:hypothetical protein [Goekera deserti]MPQ97597.1 hypothetical protein [Goekera deserti]NDI47799.1 hypothetical protein [Goekera deserti]NEL53547.1 hypothetical protein [Goekera deserti]
MNPTPDTGRTRPTLDGIGVPARIGGFVLGLLVVFAAATGVGAAVGPVDEPAGQHTTGHSTGHTP